MDFNSWYKIYNNNNIYNIKNVQKKGIKGRNMSEKFDKPSEKFDKSVGKMINRRKNSISWMKSFDEDVENGRTMSEKFDKLSENL